MRDFSELKRALELKPYFGSKYGSLFVTPSSPGVRRLVVLVFDRELPPSLIPAWAGLTAAAQAWIARDAELSSLVSVDSLVEVGSDFVARPFRSGTSLSGYADDEDPAPAPDELAPMQARFSALTATPADEREALLIRVLTRSLLAPSDETIYFEHDEKFIVVELQPQRDELERWMILDPIA